MQMQEYVKDFANRIGGRNRESGGMRIKRKNAAAGLYQTDPGRLCLAGQLGLAAGLCPEIGRYSGLGSYRKRGYVYGCIRWGSGVI